MLKNAKDIKGFRILANDTANETIGLVKDLYFDEERWRVRYLMIDTKAWIFKDLVLVSPYSVSGIDWEEGIIWVNLTKDEIEHAPKVRASVASTKKNEASFNNYLKLPQYWSNGLGLDIEGIWAGGFFSHKSDERIKKGTPDSSYALLDEQHLHPLQEVFGLHLRTVDDENFGSVESLIMDTETWGLRYIVINTHKYLPWGRSILLSPEWVEKIDWTQKKIITDYLRHTIENCPEYDSSVEIDLAREDELDLHFSRTGYWNLRNWPDSSKVGDYSRDVTR